MLSKVIGIISYLPDNEEIRDNRWHKLINLILTCNVLFNLPIHIEAQCWTSDEMDILNSMFTNVEVNTHKNKLGILGARRTLRSWFIESKYDYLIMLDDDIVLVGDVNGGKTYKEQIDKNPDGWGIFSGTLLHLFAISKTIFKKYDYLDVEPENGGGFEDRLFVEKLSKYEQGSRFIFNKAGLDAQAIVTKDKYSTWYSDQDLPTTLKNTSDLVSKL